MQLTIQWMDGTRTVEEFDSYKEMKPRLDALGRDPKCLTHSWKTTDEGRYAALNGDW
jgi:hypothetical protein